MIFKDFFQGSGIQGVFYPSFQLLRHSLFNAQQHVRPAVWI